jgi:hypothetical protein
MFYSPISPLFVIIDLLLKKLPPPISRKPDQPRALKKHGGGFGNAGCLVYLNLVDLPVRGTEPIIHSSQAATNIICKVSPALKGPRSATLVMYEGRPERHEGVE